MNRTCLTLLVLLLLVGSTVARGQRPSGAPPIDVGAETATHEEIEPLAIEFQRLTSLVLHPNGHLLACDGDTKQVKVITPAGEVVTTVSLEFAPEAIEVAPDGTIFCGGEGQLAKLAQRGRVLATGGMPSDAASDVSDSRRSWSKPNQVSGIAVAGDDVFVAFGSGWSMGSKSKLYRYDLDLKNPKLLAEGLRGCCQRCDITAADGILYLAENAVHRIVAYDRDGDVLDKWGERSRTELEGFGSCCNPMNVCFDSSGVIYTAESGLGRVKSYSKDGKYLGLVGYIGVERFTNAGHLAASCSNISIAVTPDGSRVYVMDFANNIIRVLQKKG